MADQDEILLGDPERDAQVYGTESCPYTGRVIRLLKEQGLAHDYIDLDIAHNQRLRPLLLAHTGQKSVPWVFVRGRFVGGYEELDQEARLGQLGSAPGEGVAVLAPPEKQDQRPGRAVELGEALTETSGAKRPRRPETHDPADTMKLMNLGLELEEEADGEPVTFEMMEELADDHGVPLKLVVAGAALVDDLELANDAEVRFRVCTGRCQSWGALDRLEHLISLRRQDRGDGKPNFDIEPVDCLDRCEHAPSMIVVTDHGIAGLDNVSEADLDTAVQQLCEE